MKKTSAFDEYIAIVRRLRRECPWDRDQTHESIRSMLIEEAYEVVEAIDGKDLGALKMELGDLLLHVAMHSVMASERRAFSIDDVIRASSEKLIRRHPHVFGTTKASTAREVKANWETIKMSEGRSSILDGVPKKLPALLRAMRLQEKAAKVGFDWKDKKDVWKKVEEEVGELQHAETSGNRDRIEQELGDLFFALVNYARFLGVNPEFALTKASDKFSKRFRRVEHELRKQGKEAGKVRVEEMDRMWDEGKKQETR